jgi:quinol monooxygenase YgiN
MVIVHVSVPIKTEARSRWLEIFEAVTGPTRAEEACRSYRMYEDIDAQNRFIVVEEWDGLDGLYRHFQAPHFTEFFAALGTCSPVRRRARCMRSHRRSRSTTRYGRRRDGLTIVLPLGVPGRPGDGRGQHRSRSNPGHAPSSVWPGGGAAPPRGPLRRRNGCSRRVVLRGLPQ